jgi:hypothetical protein
MHGHGKMIDIGELIFIVCIGITVYLSTYVIISIHRLQKRMDRLYSSIKITYKGITGKEEEVIENVYYYKVEGEDLIVVTDDDLLMFEMDDISKITDLKRVKNGY